MNKKLTRSVMPRLFHPDKIDWIIENDILHWIDHGLIVTLMMSNKSGEWKLLTNRNVIDLNLDEEILLKSAVENTGECYVSSPLKIPGGTGEPTLSGMRVLYMTYITVDNRNGYGAGIMLNKDVLDLAALDYGEKMVVLPSSVYEVIVGPYDENLMDIYDHMLYQINTENVDNERLSDGVFIYDSVKHDLTRYFKEEKVDDHD